MTDAEQTQSIEDPPRSAQDDPPRSAQDSPKSDGAARAGAPARDARAQHHEKNEPTTQVDGVETALQGDVDELVAVGAQRDEYLALAQRTQADFENYRKRAARESAAAQERGVAKLARELLPALDNLDRALDAADQEDPLLAGVRLVRAELSAALQRVGVEAFSPLGETFDPANHEAMAQQPVDGADTGTVVEVYQAGYRLGGAVIRPARVLVAA
jgi:molecular chaperone GrpE